MLENGGNTREATERERESCCELEKAVYDCSNCKHREYREVGEGYAVQVACENQPCHEGTPRPPDTFSSTAQLVGFRCPIHGWSAPAHLRQTPLF